MTTAFTTIPTLNLSHASDPTKLPALLSDLRHAIIDIGFLYITGHGVSDKAIKDLTDIALPHLFGRLSAEAKRAVALENSPHFLGYSGVGAETTGGKTDLREQFEFATELPAVVEGDGVPLYERLRGPNQWPNNDTSLRLIIIRYITELTALGDRFLDLVAQALSLPHGTFQPFLSDQHRLKLVRYPAQPPSSSSSASEARQGVGPHKDSSGWWTFLLQASPREIGGLQVLNKTGSWIDVPAEPGTFVVNIGQAFEVITGGVCRATTHRVRLAPRTPERFSVPFFQGVRRDLTKAEAVGALRQHFSTASFTGGGGGGGAGSEESEEAQRVDSPFLRGRYDTWGESQLRTKVRSHRENGRKFYPEVFERYINDDIS